MPIRDEGSVRAAYAWSAAQIESSFRISGPHMNPDTRAEVADIIGRLNARADGRVGHTCHCLGGGCFDCRPDTGPPTGALTDDDIDGSPDQFRTGTRPYPSSTAEEATR